MKRGLVYLVVVSGLIAALFLLASPSTALDSPRTVDSVQISPLDILRERVPAVEIDQIVPPGVRLSFVRVADEDGSFVDTVSTILDTVQNYSLVIREMDGDAEVLRGSGIQPGDVLLRGVIHSLEDADVWIFFEGGRTVILPSGTNLLIGDEDVIADSHEQVCRCKCDIRRDRGCSVTMSEIENCETHNGEACTCSVDPSAPEGTLKNCHMVWVPLQIAGA